MADVREPRRLLISYAHPDDESFGLGGLIAKYVAQGVEVYLICATNGDVGTVDAELLEGYDSVRDLRLAELKQAADILGLRRVYTLDYKDSGMTGSPHNDDPACLWYQWTHHPQTVTQKVVEVIREVRPQVVITFNKYGGYGHPDHIAIQAATTEAFTLAADPTYAPDQPAYQPQKLYYSDINTLMIRLGILIFRLRGKDPRKIGRNADIDMVKILDHQEPTHAKIDIRDYYPQWDAASACHVSQGGGKGGAFRVFPRSWRKWLSPYQAFTRIYPKPSRDTIDEYDLFENVSLV